MPDVQESHDGVCPGCANRKKTREPFPSSKNKADDILQLIHSDLCGPMPVHSFGDLYYSIFIDDFLRKTWIHYLKHKDEAFAMFKNFKALVESQTGKKIKLLRFDNGGEYISNEFIEFCGKEGIKEETTVPYYPNQNGVAKRKNRLS